MSRTFKISSTRPVVRSIGLTLFNDATSTEEITQHRMVLEDDNELRVC
jgi:hypothetical protein